MKNEEPKPIHQQIIDLVGGEDKFREIARLKRKNNKTMENEFVSYEVALSLKELGFGERTFCAFYKDSGILLAIGSGNTYDTPAPLKQQVFRWFREKCNLESCIMFRHSIEDDKEYYDWLIKGQEVVYRHFTTYEEAENACIDKLLELAKEQDNLNKCLACNEDKGNNELYCSFCRNQN
jgi:hypothetical protein